MLITSYLCVCVCVGFGMGAMIDSYYEYMLKFWLQSGKKDRLHKEMLLKALPVYHPGESHMAG